MHIAVCIKQIVNPDLATAQLRIDEDNNQVVALRGMAPVLSPFDAQAVEAALRLKEASGEDVRLTVLTLGCETARGILKTALAMGADEGVLLVDAAFDGADATVIARVLAAAILKTGDAELVLTGRQAADGDDGVIGLGISEILGRTAITLAKEVTMTDGAVRIVRVIDQGSETVEAALPAVVTVAHEIGKPRHAGLRETMRAAKKPIHAWGPDDLGLSPPDIGPDANRRIIERLYIPPSRVKCQFLEDETPTASATRLVRLLEERGVIGEPAP